MVGMVRLKLGYIKENATIRLDQAAEADDITLRLCMPAERVLWR